MVKTELPGGKFFGPIVESNLAVIGSPQRERQILEAQERAQKDRLPTPATQFQVFSW